MQKKNFTLIELLVVVAIIGILVTLLVPSLSRAREAAKLAVCMSNQSQMGQKIILYGKNRNSDLPPYGINKNILFGHHTRHFMEVSSWSSRRNLAYLWESKDDLQGDTQILYCPSQKNKAFQFDTYFNGSNLQAAAIYGWSARLRVGYNYNIRRVGSTFKPYYKKIIDIDSETVLLTDLFTQAKKMIARQDLFGHADVSGFAFLKGDGSVGNKKLKSFISTLRTGDWETAAGLNTVNGLLNQ